MNLRWNLIIKVGFLPISPTVVTSIQPKPSLSVIESFVITYSEICFFCIGWISDDSIPIHFAIPIDIQSNAEVVGVPEVCKWKMNGHKKNFTTAIIAPLQAICPRFEGLFIPVYIFAKSASYKLKPWEPTHFSSNANISVQPKCAPIGMYVSRMRPNEDPTI